MHNVASNKTVNGTYIKEIFLKVKWMRNNKIIQYILSSNIHGIPFKIVHKQCKMWSFGSRDIVK